MTGNVRPLRPEGEKRKPKQSFVGLALTDVGNAERFVERYRQRVRYCPPRRRWLVWDAKRWRWDETGRVTELAKKTARAIRDEVDAAPDKAAKEAIAMHSIRSESAPRLAAMLQLAQSAPGVPVMPQELDADPWLFNVENGTLDLRTGELKEPTPADLITKLSPVHYDPNAKHGLWGAFLATATGGDEELQEYLARVFGYALQGTAREKAFFFVYGPPDTSKSTFIDAVAGAFGEYHQGADFDTWLVQTNTGGNRGDLVRLAGARLVTSVEVRAGARFDSALIKRVTGGDLLTASAKFEAEITFRPQFALVLAANDAPAIRDDDAGMWERVRRIPFSVQIERERRDPELRAKLAQPDVQSAILAWVVRGCLDWQKSGLGTAPAIERSTAEYRESQDRAEGFFADLVFVGGDSHRMPSKELQRRYLEWCDENRVRALSGKDLAARLEAKGCRRQKSNGVRYWLGIRERRDHEYDDDGGELRDTSGPAGSSVPYSSPDRLREKGNAWEQQTLNVPGGPDDFEGFGETEFEG